MKETKKFLGERIKELRKKIGLKQSELAELVDIDSKHMSKIECGRCYPSFDLFDKITNKLGVSPSEILFIEHLETKEILTLRINEMIAKSDLQKVRQIYQIAKMM